MTNITHLHLNQCGLEIRPDQVFHDENKGEALANIIQSYPNFLNIIFVDDFEKNLQSVKTKFEQTDLLKYNLTLYQINHN
jgi:hypothetical protein